MEAVIRSEVASGSWLDEGMNRRRTEDFLSSETFMIPGIFETIIWTLGLYTATGLITVSTAFQWNTAVGGGGGCC